MATALTQQLRQLAVASGQPAGGKRLRGKPSLIWSTQEAADVDVETVYSIGREGEGLGCPERSRRAGDW